MELNSKRKLKTIAFDLDTKALEKYYKNSDYHNAYKDLGSLLNIKIAFCVSKAQFMILQRSLAMRN